jgi:hypothetical protein
MKRTNYYRKWEAEHKEERQKYRKEYGPKYRKKKLKENLHYDKEAHLKTRYNITLEDLKKLEKKQKGRCACCGKKCKLHVDHIETKNGPIIRGLLCMICNTAIGKLGDTLEGVMMAVKYLGGR